MRGEKKPLFKKEAHEEALHFGVISRDDDDEEYPNFVSILFIQFPQFSAHSFPDF